MKKVISLVLIMVACLGLVACDDETQNFYSHGFSGIAGSSDALFQADMAAVGNAFKAEFGNDSFILNGTASKCDKEVTKRFNKVVETINETVTFQSTMEFSYAVSRGNMPVVEHKFNVQP